MVVGQNKVQALKMGWGCASGAHQVQCVAFGVGMHRSDIGIGPDIEENSRSGIGDNGPDP